MEYDVNLNVHIKDKHKAIELSKEIMYHTHEANRASNELSLMVELEK